MDSESALALYFGSGKWIELCVNLRTSGITIVPTVERYISIENRGSVKTAERNLNL